MTSTALCRPFLTDDPAGRPLGPVEAATALARREADPANPESLASLACAFRTSEGQVVRAILAAQKARADAWARQEAAEKTPGPDA